MIENEEGRERERERERDMIPKVAQHKLNLPAKAPGPSCMPSSYSSFGFRIRRDRGRHGIVVVLLVPQVARNIIRRRHVARSGGRDINGWKSSPKYLGLKKVEN